MGFQQATAGAARGFGEPAGSLQARRRTRFRPEVALYYPFLLLRARIRDPAPYGSVQVPLIVGRTLVGSRERHHRDMPVYRCWVGNTQHALRNTVDHRRPAARSRFSVNA